MNNNISHIVRIERIESSKLIKVKADRNDRFNRGAKNLAGEWVPSRDEYNDPQEGGKCWKFPIEMEKHVKALCLKCYGDDGSGVNSTVTLRLTSPHKIVEHNNAFSIAGHCVVKSSLYYEGPKLGSYVALLEGEVSCQRMRYNSLTTIEPKSIFEMARIPPVMIPEFKKSAKRKGWEIEVLDDSIDVRTLEQEKESLSERIKEIDKLINTQKH